jgi:MFS family permease
MRDLIRFWTVFIGYTVSSSMTAPIIGLYAYRLGASASEVGAYYAVIAVTTFASRLPLASLVKSLGTKNLTRLGLLLNSASLAFFTLTASPSLLFIGCVLRGLGFAGFHPSALSEAVRIAGLTPERERRLGLIMTAPPIGISIGPVISSLILSQYGAPSESTAPYTAVFLIGAILSSVVVPLASGGTKTAIEERVDEPLSRLFTKPFTLLISSRFILSYVIGTVSSFLPILLVEQEILPEHEIPILFAVSAAFNVLGRPISSRIGGASQALLVSSLLTTATAPLIFLQTQWSLYASMALYGLGVGLFIPSSLITLQSLVPPSQLTMGIAFLTLGLDLGSGAGSLFTGLFTRFADLSEIIPATLAVAGLLSAATVVLLGLPDRREHGTRLEPSF